MNRCCGRFDGRLHYGVIALWDRRKKIDDKEFYGLVIGFYSSFYCALVVREFNALQGERLRFFFFSFSSACGL